MPTHRFLPTIGSFLFLGKRWFPSSIVQDYWEPSQVILRLEGLNRDSCLV
jgi:hypothetical protein